MRKFRPTRRREGSWKTLFQPSKGWCPVQRYRDRERLRWWCWRSRNKGRTDFLMIQSIRWMPSTLCKRMEFGVGCKLKGGFACSKGFLSFTLDNWTRWIWFLSPQSHWDRSSQHLSPRLWQGRSASNALVRMVDYGWGCTLPIERLIENQFCPILTCFQFGGSAPSPCHHEHPLSSLPARWLASQVQCWDKL